jgi:hypothetical protein
MVNIKNAPVPLLDPMSPVAQRVAGAQTAQALRFEGLPRTVFPASATPYWMAGGIATAYVLNTLTLGLQTLYPWFVPVTTEVTRFASRFGAGAGSPTVQIAVYASHPNTWRPDGSPIASSGAVPAAGFVQTGSVDVVLDAGMYWLAMTLVAGTGSVYAITPAIYGVNAASAVLTDLATPGGLSIASASGNESRDDTSAYTLVDNCGPVYVLVRPTGD